MYIAYLLSSTVKSYSWNRKEVLENFLPHLLCYFCSLFQTFIYSFLCFAADQSKVAGQPCMVTFDQPLFLKACDIVANAAENSALANVIVRLGGFHYS